MHNSTGIGRFLLDWNRLKFWKRLIWSTERNMATERHNRQCCEHRNHLNLNPPRFQWIKRRFHKRKVDLSTNAFNFILSLCVPLSKASFSIFFRQSRRFPLFFQVNCMFALFVWMREHECCVHIFGNCKPFFHSHFFFALRLIRLRWTLDSGSNTGPNVNEVHTEYIEWLIATDITVPPNRNRWYSIYSHSLDWIPCLQHSHTHKTLRTISSVARRTSLR